MCDNSETIARRQGPMPLPEGLPSMEQIQALQAAMRPIETEQPQPNHFFAPGMYARELTVPAGMLIVGKIHKHAHFLFVLKGRASVVSNLGREVVHAGHISVSQAGVKRIVLALEDTQFVTVHVNKEDSQDLQVIEAEHIQEEPVSQLDMQPKQEVLS